MLKTKIMGLLLLLALEVSAFSPNSAAKISSMKLASTTESSLTSTEPGGFLDVLKWDGAQPDFDVLERFKQYASEPGYISFRLRDIPDDYYSSDYVFRGPVVGPLSRKDLLETNKNFELDKSFPDLERQAFGFSVDPENPFRVLCFERWKGTHTGEFAPNGLGLELPATGNRMVTPVMPFSVWFDKEGKIIYETLAAAVDRFEGNTKGKVAVAGITETAGLPFNTSIGDPVVRVVQKINRFFNVPVHSFSKAEDVPSWWKSKSVGNDPNDV